MIAEARATGDEPKHPIPLTVELRSDARQLIISGPNTGGKTVSLKTIGLLATHNPSSATSPASPRTSSTSTASRARPHHPRSSCSTN
jgi:DNA mismatch repair protein MutS2